MAPPPGKPMQRRASTVKKMTDDRDDGSRTASMLTKKGTRLENLIEAKAAALVTGCTKITPDPKGNYKSPTGVQMSIKSFNTLTSNDSEVGQYGCPYGVRVFLEFHRHVLYAFGGMLLLATWPALNNEWRRTQRIACRAQLPHAPPECGYGNLEVRNSEGMPGGDANAMFSLGACAEYLGYNSTVLQPTQPPDELHNGHESYFVRTPGAIFCLDPDSIDWHAWLSLPLVLLWLGCLVQFGRMSRSALAQEHLESSTPTAASYAVMIDGLPTHAREDDEDVDAGLRKEITAMGLEVSHIVITAHCAAEMRVMRQIASTLVQKEDAPAGDTACDTKLAALRKELAELLAKAAPTTGHAFVVFQLAADRKRFVEAQHLLKASSGGGLLRQVTVEAAPEPSAVIWENLQLGALYMNSVRLAIYAISTVLILAGFVTIILVRRLAGLREMEHMFGTMLTPPEAHIDMSALVDGETAATLMTSAVTVTVNTILNLLVVQLNALQGLNTREAEEISLYTKLVIIYVFNTVLVPGVYGMLVSLETCSEGRIFHLLGAQSDATNTTELDWNELSRIEISFGCPLIQESWYENGGVIASLVTLAISTGACNAFMNVCPPVPILNRYILAPLTSSRIGLKQLWQGQPMILGDLYARLTMLIAIGIVYSPLDPKLLVVVGLMVWVNLVSLRFGIANWFTRPFKVNFALSDRMIRTLRLLLLLHLAITYAGGQGATGSNETPRSPVLVSLVVLVVGLIGINVWAHGFTQDDFADTTTKGVRYEDVDDIERYVCPHDRKLTAEEMEAECFHRGFTGGFIDEVWVNTQRVDAAAPSEKTPLVAP